MKTSSMDAQFGILRELIADYIYQDIKQVLLKQYVKDLVKLNFPNTKLPIKFTFKFDSEKVVIYNVPHWGKYEKLSNVLNSDVLTRYYQLLPKIAFRQLYLQD